MKAAPYTVTCVLALVVCMLVLFVVIVPRLALAGELARVSFDLTGQLSDVATQLSDMKTDFIIQKKRERLAALQQELYTVQREESRMRVQRMQVPDLYDLQKTRLQHDIDNTTTEIAAFLRANPQVLNR